MATASGPRNSKVTARPRPSRSIAQYSERFIVPYTAASSRTGHHCAQLNERNRGRPAASSTIPAIHCRTATTPTGPSTGNAMAPAAAPSWLDSALPSIRAGPDHARAPAPGLARRIWCALPASRDGSSRSGAVRIGPAWYLLPFA